MVRPVAIIVLVSLLILPGALTHFDKVWIQRKADLAEKGARDSAEVYTDNKYSTYSTYSAGLGVWDTLLVISPDSAETLLITVDTLDTARFESTSPIRMDELIGYLDTFYRDSIQLRILKSGGEFSGKVVGNLYKSDSTEADSLYATIGSVPSSDSLDSCLARIAVLEAELDTADVHNEIRWAYFYASQDTIDKYAPGWWLCNGANGTPNLLNRVMIGAGDVYATADSGGDTLVTHSMGGHTHSISASGTHTHSLSGITDTALAQRFISGGSFVGVEVSGVPSVAAGGDHDHGAATGSGNASIDDIDVRQPYYGLVPIMRKKYGS